MTAARSKTVTWTFVYLASVIAQVSPDIPAPTMMTCSMVFRVFRVSRLSSRVQIDGTLWQQMNKRRPRTWPDSLFRVTRHFYCRATWPKIDFVLGFTNTGMQQPGRTRLSVQCTQTLSLLPNWCCVTSWLTTHIFLGGEWFFFKMPRERVGPVRPGLDWNLG